MDGPTKNPVAATSRGAATRPYTGVGDGERNVVSSPEAGAIRTLDRNVAEGLNLVHDQFAVMRRERLDDRAEFREFRKEIREDLKEIRKEFTAALFRVEAQAEQKAKEQETRFTGLEGAIRELTAQVSTALERTWGIRRLVWGVLGTLALLVAGGVIRPVFERAVAGLFGG